MLTPEQLEKLRAGLHIVVTAAIANAFRIKSGHEKLLHAFENEPAESPADDVARRIFMDMTANGIIEKVNDVARAMHKLIERLEELESPIDRLELLKIAEDVRDVLPKMDAVRAMGHQAEAQYHNGLAECN